MLKKLTYACGGRYEAFAKAYKGDKVAHPYGRLVNLYQEKTAASINTMTGKPYAGYTKYIPPALSTIGEEIPHEGYDLHMITFKPMPAAPSRSWLAAPCSSTPSSATPVSAMWLAARRCSMTAW